LNQSRDLAGGGWFGSQFASSRQSQGLPGRCDYKSKSKRHPAPPPCPICPHSMPKRPGCGSRTPLPLPPTHPPQPYDRMGLQLHTGVLRVDFQEPRGRSYWRVLALVLLYAARCVLESKSASLRAAAGVPLASHTPCLGALVTIPPRLMQSYHCLEIWAAARVSWLKGSARRQMLLHETSSFTSPNTAHQSGMASWPLSQYVPSRWRWLPHALPCAQARRSQP
jgi:hypothetical protein